MVTASRKKNLDFWWMPLYRQAQSYWALLPMEHAFSWWQLPPNSTLKYTLAACKEMCCPSAGWKAGAFPPVSTGKESGRGAGEGAREGRMGVGRAETGLVTSKMGVRRVQEGWMQWRLPGFYPLQDSLSTPFLRSYLCQQFKSSSPCKDTCSTLRPHPTPTPPWIQHTPFQHSCTSGGGEG